MNESPQNRPDSDARKGAVESDRPDSPANESNGANESMAGQLGHRDPDPAIKDNDTDFPEPDAKAEHSGQP
jgi:hypothetical protein